MYKKKLKKILFFTGSRADYGKLKPLINITKADKKFKVNIMATGMHTQKHYGYTYREIIKDFNEVKLIKFVNQKKSDPMDIILIKTIKILGKALKIVRPDLVVIHGDRIETLAASVYCNLNNILIAHVEGGEVSGTVDESLRHSTTKLSHSHFVSNKKAKDLLKKMGEGKKNIFVIGSPEVDIMLSKKLPSIKDVMKRYNIKFKNYAILLYHPVTTLKKKEIIKECNIFFSVLKKSSKKFILIYPNNDTHSEIIFKHIEKLKKNKNFKILPSLRFEYYLTLLKYSDFIIGNSSSGIREAPIYGVKSINLGNRQKNRLTSKFIKNLNFQKKRIINEINKPIKKNIKRQFNFGRGNSAKKFIQIIKRSSFWKIDKQKYFLHN